MLPAGRAGAFPPSPSNRGRAKRGTRGIVKRKETKEGNDRNGAQQPAVFRRLRQRALAVFGKSERVYASARESFIKGDRWRGEPALERSTVTMFWLPRRSLLVELCVCVFGRQLGAGKERKAQASLLEERTKNEQY